MGFQVNCNRQIVDKKFVILVMEWIIYSLNAYVHHAFFLVYDTWMLGNT